MFSFSNHSMVKVGLGGSGCISIGSSFKRQVIESLYNLTQQGLVYAGSVLYLAEPGSVHTADVLLLYNERVMGSYPTASHSKD